MSIYPSKSCRNCVHANWVWSDKKYPDGFHRIIIQHPAKCSANPTFSAVGSNTEFIYAKEPFTDCSEWKYHNDSSKARQ